MKLLNSYTEYIEKEYFRRCRLNTAYSMRSFARDLQITPSKLSEVLAGKQGLSRKSGSELCVKIGLKGVEKDYFLLLIDAKDGRGKKTRLEARKLVTEIRAKYGADSNKLDLEIFDLIKDWSYFACMELLEVNHGQYDTAEFAKKLGIPKREVASLMTKLEQLELIRKESDNCYKRVKKNFSTQQDIPNESIREFHKQILAKAQQEIDFQNVNEREFNGLIFKVHKDKVPELKKILRQSIQEVNALVEEWNQKEAPNCVYSYNNQLFSLIKGGGTYEKTF